MHEKPMNTGDFSDFYCFHSIKIFSCLVLMLALNRVENHCVRAGLARWGFGGSIR